MTHRERFFAALRGEAIDRVPVFPLLMHLTVDRAGITYREFARNGSALAQAQLLMQQVYDLDAITACSDAFRVSADLGGDIVFPEQKPPYLASPLLTHAGDLQKLGRPDPSDSNSRMGDRVRAVAEMAGAAGDEVGVLGWVDMPFAEACSACGVTEFMLMIVDEPDFAHAVLARLTEIVIDFALAQAAAGAVMIGAGDAAASLISPPMYREFALLYEQQVCAAVHAAGGLVKLHVCGDTTALLPDMATCGADLFNVDHLVPFAAAAAIYGAHGKCFKGNLNPVAEIMQADEAACREAAFRCMRAAAGTRYMLSAGCEIPAETPDAVFRAFCDAPKQFVVAWPSRP